MKRRTLEFLVELGTRLSPEKLALLVSKLERMERLEDLRGLSHSMKTWLGTVDAERLERVCREDADVKASECIVALRSSYLAREALESERVKATLVWTGPETPLVPTRRTEEVFLEVVRSARRKLFVVSFVAYKVDRILEALREATERGVAVKVLLESTSDHGGKIFMDSIGYLHETLPKAALYWWDEDGASVHAKCVVADGSKALVTSANLTGAAMERNMELGVLLEGGEAPRRLHDHLEALVTTKKIAEV